MSIITDIGVSKPSKALNVIYFIFGYIIASAVVPTEFDVIEQVGVIIAVGSIFATFLFYVKPVERALWIAILWLKKREQRKGFSLFRESPKEPLIESRPLAQEVFDSPMIAYEKARIKGAVFFSLSILISGRALALIGIPQPTIYLVLFSLPTLVIACWEGYGLWKKFRVLAFFYNFMHEGEVSSQIIDTLRKAIERKDWLEARIIISNRFTSGASFGKGGVCIKCQAVKLGGNYCDICGKRLLTHCPNCQVPLIGMKTFPKFCPFCGKRLPK